MRRMRGPPPPPFSSPTGLIRQIGETKLRTSDPFVVVVPVYVVLVSYDVVYDVVYDVSWKKGGPRTPRVGPQDCHKDCVHH